VYESDTDTKKRFQTNTNDYKGLLTESLSGDDLSLLRNNKLITIKT
jgi:hypothetical protein